MTLQELLDELRFNILHDRSDRVAGTPDYLWSNASLVRYINEAQRRYARLGLLIRDGSSDVTRVTLQAGINQYALDPSILAVMSVRYPGDTADLARGGHAAFDTYHQPDPYYFDPSQLSTVGPGKPLAFATDDYLSPDGDDSMSVVTLRVFPVPGNLQNGQVLQMRVVRMPLNDLTSSDMTAIPEIPVDHHLEMLDWAAYLALRIVDIDAGAPARAADFKRTFEENVQKARNNAMRKLFAPSQWGFGRNGFSWDR